MVPHMRKQRLFASTADVLDLLRRRNMPLSAFRSAAFREAAQAATAGTVAIVHDEAETGAMVVGKALPLVLAATLTSGTAPHIELVVKQAEALSLYNRIAHR